jgi:hypothetical protein
MTSTIAQPNSIAVAPTDGLTVGLDRSVGQLDDDLSYLAKSPPEGVLLM